LEKIRGIFSIREKTAKPDFIVGPKQQGEKNGKHYF
jgi:hypothetical protein